MARRVNATSYRLGYARWWEERTPQTNWKVARKTSRKWIEMKELIEGMMRKFGIITGDFRMNKWANGKIVITIFAKPKKLNKGEERYITHYITQLSKKYFNANIIILYREVATIDASAEIMNKSLELTLDMRKVLS